MELVRISTDYIEELRKADYRVQSNALEQGKETKPFLGVLFSLKSNGIQYFVPLSSPKGKHQTMPNSSDFHKVVSKKGKLRAVLNFNNMLPCTSDLCTKIDLHIDKDRFVLMDEYVFCRDNEKMLQKKAQKFYSRYCKGELNESEAKRSCDFHKLENVLLKYTNQENNSTSSASQLPQQTAVTNKPSEALQAMRAGVPKKGLNKGLAQGNNNGFSMG